MKMERVSSKENFLLAYATHRAYESPASPVRSPDVDFNDVFGGPPRRFSLHEKQYSSDGGRESEETSLFRSLSGEKPVFGVESSASRRKNGPSRDFFDDIFKGGKSSSSPRSEFTSSLPGSRVMSPSKPLPPKSEPFGTSLPAHFSLPATLTKAMDYPTFGSNSSLRKRESQVSGISTPSSSLSRFSSQTMPVQDEVKSDAVSPLNGQGPLSNELFLRNEELSYGDKSNEENIRRNLRGDLKATEAPNGINEFHFSIYKWASSGVPITMPLCKEISSKPKARDKLVTSSSSKGSVQNDEVGEFLQSNVCSTDTHSISVKSEFSKMECDEIAKTITLKGAQPDVLDTTQVTAEKILEGTLLSNKREQTTPDSLPEMGFSKKSVEVFTVIGEDRKPVLMPLHSILSDDIEGEENENIVMKVEGKGNVTKTTELPHSNVVASKDVKKHGWKIINSDKTEMSKAISQGSPSSPGGNTKRNGVRGKVKDFVKIFNQEPSSKIQSNASKTQSNADPHNMSGRWEGNISGTKLNEESTNTTEMDLQKPLPVDKIQDISFKENENVGKPEKHHPHKKSTISTSIDNSSGPKEDLPKSFQSQMKSTIRKGFDNSSELKESPPTSFQSQMKSTVSTNNDSSSDQKEAYQFSDLIPDGPTVARGSIDDPFQVNFLIQELSDDQIKPSQTNEEREAIKALDAKIHKWSSGKNGNIRSLLSTLQYVLWPESGWKTVPLVNIIEGNAVKRAYQKAMLCLHPDKLQQKGASSIQKYNAEKVFDILQEAWDHFNTLGSI